MKYIKMDKTDPMTTEEMIKSLNCCIDSNCEACLLYPFTHFNGRRLSCNAYLSYNIINKLETLMKREE